MTRNFLVLLCALVIFDFLNLPKTFVLRYTKEKPSYQHPSCRIPSPRTVCWPNASKAVAAPIVALKPVSVDSFLRFWVKLAVCLAVCRRVETRPFAARSTALAVISMRCAPALLVTYDVICRLQFEILRKRTPHSRVPATIVWQKCCRTFSAKVLHSISSETRCLPIHWRNWRR